MPVTNATVCRRDPLARERSRLFDQQAEAYDRFRPTYPDAVIDDVLGPVPDGLDVLDVGCGTGIASRQIAQRGARVLGVELGPRMAEVARGHGIAVEIAAFEGWDPAGRTFDRVTSAQAWHWLDLPVATAKAASVLRPGGKLCLIWNAGCQPDGPGRCPRRGVCEGGATRQSPCLPGICGRPAVLILGRDWMRRWPPSQPWPIWVHRREVVPLDVGPTSATSGWHQLLSRSDHTALEPEVLDRLFEGIGGQSTTTAARSS